MTAEKALIAQPTTALNKPASINGTRQNVNVPGPFGDDDIKSYLRTDKDGKKFILNVTMNNHAVKSGYVIRQLVENSDGKGWAVRTYGEGDNWKQIGPFGDAQAERYWIGQTHLLADILNRR